MKASRTAACRSSFKLGAASLAIALAAFSSPASAQNVGPVEGQPVDAAADGAEVDEAIVVTGSRIRSANLESASPITAVTAEEFRQTGTTRTEDLINQLPQVFAGQNSGVSNGSSGTATINLRGLGAERNLVLVNGRRLLPGDPGSSAADINAIPGAILQRVDVLTGGASSVYGADAVTGVVNFITDTTFEGFRLDGQYSLYNHGNGTSDDVRQAQQARGFPSPSGPVVDGGTVDATMMFGTSLGDGRGHIMAYAGYRRINAVTQDRRVYSACALSARTQAQVDAGGGLGDYTCGGSATSANGTFFLGDGSVVQLGPNSTFIPGQTPFNFAPNNYFQRPDERYTAGFFANYEVAEGVETYGEFMFMDDRTVAQIAPSGNFGNTLTINCDNPLLSAQQRSLACAPANLLTSADGSIEAGQPAFGFIDPVTGTTYNRGSLQILRRNVEGGPRRDDLQHTSFRGVAGVRGDAGPAWSYDAYVQYGRTNFAETYFNDFSVSRLTNALDVISGPGGTPICRAAQVGGSDPNCVPYNIFGGGVTPEALNYLQVPGFQRGLNGQTVLNASLSGALGEYGVRSPWAEEGVGLVVGTEYRRETLDFFSDLTFQTGDLAGQGAATLPVSGGFDVNEIFSEVRIPVVSRGFFYDLSFTGGYRFSRYTNTAGGRFSTDTYKLEGQFAPISDIRIRGGYNRAVRAPTIQDLFAPNRVALNGSSDPCAGFAITAANAGCLAQGLTVGQVVQENPAGQYNGFIGGNANLAPEVADTYTVGVVLQPTFLPNFALSVDYFDISLDGAISGIGQDTILQVCTDTADPFFCGLINRDQFGSIWRTPQGFVTDTTQNIGGLSTRGIDVNASYSLPLSGLGNLGFTFVGTYLDSISVDTGVSGSYDCVGLYGNVCGLPNPEWRHQARVSLNTPEGFGVSVRWRYIGPVTIDALDSNPNLNNASPAGPAPGGVARPGLARLGVTNYVDLALTARVSDNYTFRLGANNLLDQAPPLTASQSCPAGSCNGNTWPGVYDALGRYIYVGVTLDF